LGKHFSDRLNLQDGHQLITSGPYRWVRHPMYSFLVSIFYRIGRAGGECSDWNLQCIAGRHIWVRIRKEEEMLRQHFGKVFDEYALRTPAVDSRF